MLVSLYLSLVGSDPLTTWEAGASHFKYKVSVQGLWIENAMVSQDLMIQIDAIFFAINFVQFFLGVNTRGFCISHT